MVLAHMYHLKYFIPLVLEAKKNGIVTNMYTFHSGVASISKSKGFKNHPYNYIEHIGGLGRQYGFNFEFCHVDDSEKVEGLTFFVEKRGLSNLENNKNISKVVLVCLLDFSNPNWYNKYSKTVDKIIFPSRYVAEHYNSICDKNLYLGSPKYDVISDKEKIKLKYGVVSDKNALVLTPELNTLDISNLPKLCGTLRDNGYTIIVKGRQKQPSLSDREGDYYFDDKYWFPYPTMELIEICDVVISYDSAVSKECVMGSTPFVNIHVTKGWLPFECFYEYKFCKNLSSSQEGLSRFISTLDDDFKEEFKRCRLKYLFDKQNSSKKILEALNV